MLEKIRKYDDILIEKVSALHSPFTNKVMRFLTFIGDQGKVWILIWAIICYLRRSLYIGVSILGSVLFAFISSEVIIKRIVARVRPCNKIDEEKLVLKRIPKFYSFPSSHSTTSFAMLTLTMIHCSFPTILIVFILAVGISFSRFYLQAHYLTDVLCGVAIGISFSLGMWAIIYSIFYAIDPAMMK